MIVVQTVGQEAIGYDVGGRYVGLDFCEIAEPPDVIVIFTSRKFGNDHVVVLTIESVKEPDFAFFNRTRKSKPRIHFVEGQSFLALYGRHEVSGRKTKVIVANSGLKAKDPGRAVSVLCWNAAGFSLHDAQCVGADADEELSVGGLSHVESVKQD